MSSELPLINEVCPLQGAYVPRLAEPVFYRREIVHSPGDVFSHCECVTHGQFYPYDRDLKEYEEKWRESPSDPSIALAIFLAQNAERYFDKTPLCLANVAGFCAFKNGWDKAVGEGLVDLTSKTGVADLLRAVAMLRNTWEWGTCFSTWFERAIRRNPKGLTHCYHPGHGFNIRKGALKFDPVVADSRKGQIDPRSEMLKLQNTES